MTSLMLILPSFFLCVYSFGQNQTFEVFGTISGDYNSKIYFFYDGNYRQKDSLCAEIINGKFYFKATSSLPIQARFHLDQQSYIQDVYLEGEKIYLTCTNKIDTYGEKKDTMNMFTVTDVKGSKSEILKRRFENWLAKLKASDKTEEQKNQEYYDRLYQVVRKNSKNKVSAYLIGKASSLRYSQVSTLRSLVDASLNNTFEVKAISKLLNGLDKTKNKVTGTAFLDVALKDTLGVSLSMGDLRGKYVLVYFWASWCKPCRESGPGLRMLNSKLKNRDFEMLGISFDKDEKKWKAAILKDSLHWKQVIDKNGFSGDLSVHYDIEAIPQNILVDKEGKIIGVGLSVDEIEQAVKE